MLTTENYVRMAKEGLGNANMTDRELGELIGFSQPAISQARYGRMSDALAMRIADAAGVDRGEVLTIARWSRENDEEVKAALLEWAVKIQALVSENKAAATDLMRGGMGASRRIVRGSASAKLTI